MKKYSFILLAALAMGFTACEEGPATAPVQTNPQPPVFEVSDVAVSSVENIEPVVMADLNDAGVYEVCVAHLDKLENLAPGFALDVKALYAAEEYAYEDLDEEGNTVSVLLDQEDIESITMGTMPVTVKGNDLYVSTADLQEAYLAIYNKVENVAEDINLLFSVGTRYAATVGDQYAFLGYAAPMTVNLTPDFVMSLFVIENGQQTSMALGTSDGKRFLGFVYLTGGYKLGDLRKGVVYGADYSETGEEIMVENAKADFTVTEGEGLYFVECFINTGRITAARITSVSMIGGFNSWDGDLELSPVAGSNNLVWTVTTDAIPAGDLWKFRMNNDWKYNLGGTLDDLQPNGANLTWPDDAEHTVTLYLNETPNRCTID